ncbi:heme A synthase [Aliikangiella marina]|uniref:Heme A synthase n=1 Tax=Aliikangiella marina TaxID=1712262 RepID=A0A545T970_9GAMM|nr:COX15/CtaA family protein [Aliikangiella marina]TQV73762.1 heme A synthase [Aliikangiella marina]
MKSKFARNLAIFATAFAMVVVILGAFTRLTDAGLGCPDWPGCYGFMHIPTAEEHIEAANEAFPETPYEFAKAWPEMVHRYVAGTLGLLVLWLAIISWRNKDRLAVKHSTFLLILITFQAALGAWTVTMKLHPVIVMLHLMGGITTFSLLAALAARYYYQSGSPVSNTWAIDNKKVVIFTLVVIALQVALGGWVSANYAAMVCHELPICQGNWLSDGDFSTGFQLKIPYAETYEFGTLDQNARIAIHATHRIGAIVASVVMLYLVYLLISQRADSVLKNIGYILLGLLIVQVLLGVNNIVMKLPLWNAVAHNAGGALLVVVMAVLLTLILMPKQQQLEEKSNA